MRPAVLLAQVALFVSLHHMPASSGPIASFFQYILRYLAEISRRQIVMPEGPCGQSDRIQPRQRIIGGLEAAIHAHPWIISLRAANENKHYCAAVLIRVDERDETDIALTAAHCAINDEPIDAVIGAHYLKQAVEGQISVRVAKFYPYYLYLEEYAMNDIALVKLNKTVRFNDERQPICLPEWDEETPFGAMAFAAGWGVQKEPKVNKTSSLSNELHQVALPILNSSACSSLFKDFYPGMMICAGGARAKDTCQGDSGGPLVVHGSDGYQLLGLISYGHRCGKPGVPGVATRVAKFIAWIVRKSKEVSSMYA